MEGDRCMFKEFVDLVAFIVTEPIKVASEIISDLSDAVDKTIRAKSSGTVQTNNFDSSYHEPGFGTIIYCEILFGGAEHSGIYVGNRKAIALDGNGEVVQVSLEEFTNNLTTTNQDIYIPFFCNISNMPVKFPSAANRALSMIGEKKRLSYTAG